MNNQFEKFQVTELKFKAIRILLDSGSTATEIAAYMGCGTTTVNRIRRCDTYEEYKQLMAAVAAGNRARNERKRAAVAAPVVPAVPVAPVPAPAPEPPKQVVEYRQSVTVQATHYMEMELKRHTELLTAISNKLAFIVEELAGPTKEAK